MRVVVGVPEHHVSRKNLVPAMEAVTRLNEDMIRMGEVPTFDEALREGRVKWHPEPPGEERFDHAGTVLARGHGDCDDLASWAAATGRDPGAVADMYKSGPQRWHAVVKQSDGSISDPSLSAGMPTHGGIKQPGSVSGIFPAAVPLMQQAQVLGGGAARPTVAIRPVRGRHGIGWQARADMPMTDTDSALVALHYAPVAANAAIGAVSGAARLAHACGTLVDPETWEPLDAIAGCLAGVEIEELVKMCGPEATARALEWCRRAHSVVGDPLFF